MFTEPDKRGRPIVVIQTCTQDADIYWRPSTMEVLVQDWAPLDEYGHAWGNELVTALRLDSGPVVAFDLDGTLVESVPYAAYENDDIPVLSSAQPVPHVVRYAARLQAAGLRIVIVTGRHHRVSMATQAVLDRLGLGPVPVHERASAVFELRQAVKEKAEAIRRSGAFLMIGDRLDLDGHAAELAGVAYLDVTGIPR